MTVIEIVNKVLRRLRESQVTDLAETEYSSLITDFVVDIHAEMLDYEWSSMEHTTELSVDANQIVLDISRIEADGGDIVSGSRVPTVASIPYWAKVFDTSVSTQGYPLGLAFPESAADEYHTDQSARAEYPATIALRAHPDRDGLHGSLNPPPNAACTVRLRLWTPEDEIDPDTDADRTVLVPWRPIYLGALYLALNERGEEIGEPGGLAERRYNRAVDQSKEADQVRKNDANRYIANRE